MDQSLKFKVISTYFEYDGSSRLLLQNTGEAEGLQVWVRVVDEAGVAVGEQSLHIVEDEAKLIHVLYCLLVCGVLCLQRGCEATNGGGVQNFTHLERSPNVCHQKIEGNMTNCKHYHAQIQA